METSYQSYTTYKKQKVIVICNFSTRSHKKHQDIVNEEDADENASIKQPTKEELALPKNVQPVWYVNTLKS